MITGFFFIILGLLILFYPQILVILISGFFVVFGLGIVATSWQFRRMRRHSESRFINWITRY